MKKNNEFQSGYLRALGTATAGGRSEAAPPDSVSPRDGVTLSHVSSGLSTTHPTAFINIMFAAI